MSRTVSMAPSRGHVGRSPAAKRSRMARSSSALYVAWSVTRSLDRDDDLPELLRGGEASKGLAPAREWPHAVHRRMQAAGTQLGHHGVEFRVVSHRRAEDGPLIPEQPAHVSLHHR